MSNSRMVGLGVIGFVVCYFFLERRFPPLPQSQIQLYSFVCGAILAAIGRFST